MLHLLSSRKTCEEKKPTDAKFAMKVLDYSKRSNVEFFRRIGGEPDFAGKTVLDVGCGAGATVFCAAMKGAKEAVGVDVNSKALAFANLILQKQQQPNVMFTDKMPDKKFDIVLSKDSFEHYDNPEEFILTLKSRIEQNGKLFIGFSPLWKSPYGGHIGGLTKLPWAHLIFPEKILMQELSRFQGEKVQSFQEHGLNKMTQNRYRKIIQDAGLKFVFFKTNVSSGKSRIVFAMLRALCAIKPIREYFTVNVYSIIEQ